MPDYNNQEEILDAWKNFIARGVILENQVRPIVARAWQRCRNLNLDPWSTDYPKCSNSLLQKKRKQYEEILFRVNPILEYAFILLNCNISINDSEGFVFELMTPLNYYPRTLGTYVNEATCGCGATTITLKEGVPLRTDGFEHYRVITHTSSNACAPIFFGHTLKGTINAVNPFGYLPDKALPILVAATKMAEEFLLDEKKLNNANELLGFKKMIDCCTKEWVVVLDEEGTILTANQLFIDSMGHGDSNLVINKPISNFVFEAKELINAVNRTQEPCDKNMFTFIPIAEERKKSADQGLLLRSRRIRFPQGDIHSVIIFDRSTHQEANNFSITHGTTRGAYISQHMNQKSQKVDYIGNSKEWLRVTEIIQKAARFPSNVLLLGETGTGKDVVARAIHKMSQREGNFVAINCGSIPKDLLNSELFGYESGAFTGAKTQGSVGKFEYAHKGTLFLDEIGEMPVDMQVSLLRFIQERTVTRIGSNKPRKVDVRLIAATNRNLTELIEKGLFRQDLYYRLNVIEIKLPPLRERKSDIPLLAEHFILELCKQFNIKPIPLSDDALDILVQYDWPGNVRELKNVIEKAIILSDGVAIRPEALPLDVLHYHKHISPVRESNSIMEETNALSECQKIVKTLEKHNGNIVKTANDLGIARNTLYRRIEKYNIKLKTFAVSK